MAIPIGILFFGLGVPMSLAQLLSSHFNLTLTPDAFTFGTLRVNRLIGGQM
jgi:hypothetical protein